MKEGAIFLVQTFHVFDVRECLSIVLVFLLSSPSFDYEGSDSEHESFQKILSQKFELAPGLSHGAKIRKFIKIRHMVGCAMFQTMWLVETVL